MLNRKLTAPCSLGTRAARIHRRRGRWRRRPWNIIEIEEVEQLGLRHMARGEMRVRANKAILHELDDRRMILGNIVDIMFPGIGEMLKFGTAHNSPADSKFQKCLHPISSSANAGQRTATLQT